MHNKKKIPAQGTHFVCSATPHQQVDKHRSNETIVGLYIYVPEVERDFSSEVDDALN